MNVMKLSASLLALAMASGTAYAKVSNQEATKLGGELTAMGAQQAANKAGTIPAYTGGLAQDASADPYANIYANEKPLFVINQANLAQYKNNLTAGQLAMFEKFPETYTMPISYCQLPAEHFGQG